ncbi:MAG: rhodanese-related sulfurtransferase [Patescibacteria group bacterium]
MHQIILFYKYIYLDNPEEIKNKQKKICSQLNLVGRCIIAHEGINATFEGTQENIKKYILELEKDNRFLNIHFKISSSSGNSFPKLSIKTRKEIVSLDLTCDIDPNQITGLRLSPEELYEWIQGPNETKKEFYIVDMRNIYEQKVGNFKNSILMPLTNFRDLPKFIKNIEHLKNKTIVTVCTGGVRCEKASGFLLSQNFKDVYQLDGGIVSYMEKYPNEDFQGKLYVFDQRIAMGFYTDDPKRNTSQLSATVIGECEACKKPSENYINCLNLFCHRHFIICEECLVENKNQLCPKSCILTRYGKKVIILKIKNIFKNIFKKSFIKLKKLFFNLAKNSIFKILKIIFYIKKNYETIFR